MTKSTVMKHRNKSMLYGIGGVHSFDGVGLHGGDDDMYIGLFTIPPQKECFSPTESAGEKNSNLKKGRFEKIFEGL